MTKNALLIATALVFVANIANAQTSSLCTQTENTVWSGLGHGKTYSLCASKNLTLTTGYLQYRAGKQGKVEFTYPSTLTPPKGHFTFDELANGAELTFENGAYSYTILEPLAGQSEIDVMKGNRTLATISLQDTTQSLTENDTINLFQAVGISE